MDFALHEWLFFQKGSLTLCENKAIHSKVRLTIPLQRNHVQGNNTRDEIVIKEGEKEERKP